MLKVLIFILFTVESALCGFERTEVGARSCAMGYASTGLADDAWAMFYNVGGLPLLMQRQVSVFYSPQPFGLSELSCGAVAAAMPTSFGVVGLGARRYGFELYREFSLTLSYANTISAVHVGLNLNYHTVSIKNYGSTGAFGIDAGCLVELAKQLQWGVSIRNINSPTIGSSSEKLPQTFTTGLAYFPAENIDLTLEVQKETMFDPSARFGFEYWIIDAVALRGGVADMPSQFSGGVGIRYSFFEIDYGFSMHQELGITHYFSITIH